MIRDEIKKRAADLRLTAQMANDPSVHRAETLAANAWEARMLAALDEQAGE